MLNRMPKLPPMPQPTTFVLAFQAIDYLQARVKQRARARGKPGLAWSRLDVRAVKFLIKEYEEREEEFDEIAEKEDQAEEKLSKLDEVGFAANELRRALADADTVVLDARARRALKDLSYVLDAAGLI